MNLNLNEVPNDGQFFACIIGTGPAGVTVANKLARAGKKVLLLEGGSETYTTFSQELYKGTVIGDKYFPLDTARLRYFGGTSNHWGGWCRPLDAGDFEAKGSFTKTRWPITKSDLDTYLMEARYILNLRDREEDELFENSGLRHVHFAFSKPIVRFATKYGEELISSENISLIFDANVLSFNTDGTSVTSVEVYNRDGNPIKLRAKNFVLATGGIENSRLLLWANIKTNSQLIKNPRTLGRYWMDHPTFSVGQAILDSKLSLKAGRKGIIFFSPTRRAMLEQNILNCGLRFKPVSYDGTKKIIADLACVAPDLAGRAFAMLGHDLICGATIRASWEQEPVETNRIELSDEVDRLGMPRPVLFWKKNGTDLRTVRKTAEILGKYLAEKDIGRLKLDGWVLGEEEYPDDDELAGYHHMGGTRMASNPNEGIVDRNCQVFGQSNFFIAGSSVFPSCGYANPTLTIVQLALRLGDHLLGNP